MSPLYNNREQRAPQELYARTHAPHAAHKHAVLLNFSYRINDTQNKNDMTASA